MPHVHFSISLSVTNTAQFSFSYKLFFFVCVCYCFNLGQGRFRGFFFVCVCVNRNVFYFKHGNNKELFSFFFNLKNQTFGTAMQLVGQTRSPLHPFVACQTITLSVSHKYFVRMGWLLCVISNLFCFCLQCVVFLFGGWGVLI